jgi:hypothetical protein
MAIDPAQLDQRNGQVSRLLQYLPAIFQEAPNDKANPRTPLPLGRFLMAFESILLGLPKTRPAEWADLEQQPGFEEIVGGALEEGTSELLLDGIPALFRPGSR